MPVSLESFPISRPKKIGLLGGGQLARMLCLSGQRLGFSMHVMSPSSTDPAAQVSPHHFPGDPKDIVALKEFIKEIDILTFESEFFPASVIEGAAQDKAALECWPSPQSLGLLQDKLSQKQLLVQAGIATAEFRSLSNNEHLADLWNHFPKGFVIKKRQGGYDGNGTFLFRSKKQNPKSLPQANNFCEYYAELLVPMRRELALMLFRDRYGHVESFPLVELEQKNQRLDFLSGPIRDSRQDLLIKKMKDLLKKINYVGAMGVELFDTPKGLLVNELAPRVHNSGHYSQLSFPLDQFALHLLCVSGLPLPKKNPLLQSAFAMANLIGSGAANLRLPTEMQGQIHWYGKLESRQGRKMGHVNYSGANRLKLLQTAKLERRKIKL